MGQENLTVTMSTKTETLYVCSNCDTQSLRWTGQCLECNAWGTIAPEVASAHAGAGQPSRSGGKKRTIPSLALTEFSTIAAHTHERRRTMIGEVDRVLGGGIVQGSVMLIGGEPGIGKSTLALMIAAELAKHEKVLYISGEESAAQVKMRADRISLKTEKLFFASDTNVDSVIATIREHKPALAIIDSVQTLYSANLPADAGSLNQIRYATSEVVRLAKTSDIPVLLIGHVTKDGQVAGPKALEHFVDTVLSFEGDRTGALRILRAAKNRFGSTDETGIFLMEEKGLVELRNPSGYILEDRPTNVPGSAVSCILEGTRPIVVEIQALVQKTGFGYPTRRVTGFDQSRLEMLIAVLARRADIDLTDSDVFVNIVGGFKVKEPAIDLAVALALASAARNVPLPQQMTQWGEIGLGGEIRSVSAWSKRFQEASSLGLTEIITALPKKEKIPTLAGVKIHNVHRLKDAIALILNAHE